MKLKQFLDQVLFRVHFDPSLHGTIFGKKNVFIKILLKDIFPLNVSFS